MFSLSVWYLSNPRVRGCEGPNSAYANEMKDLDSIPAKSILGKVENTYYEAVQGLTIRRGHRNVKLSSTLKKYNSHLNYITNIYISKWI